MSVIALVLLLASLFSTETAEVWCRVAVGATAETDDDSPYFGYPAVGITHTSISTNRHAAATRLRTGCVSVSTTLSGNHVADVPTFSLPQLDAAVSPVTAERFIFLTKTIARVSETRGPPTRAEHFAHPPPRAPPLT